MTIMIRGYLMLIKLYEMGNMSTNYYEDKVIQVVAVVKINLHSISAKQ